MERINGKEMEFRQKKYNGRETRIEEGGGDEGERSEEKNNGRRRATDDEKWRSRWKI